ncbi:MAG: ADP-ribosylglycohydrolase family protein [Gemmatimonadota bacterium]|nr:ADP-ribosylglycohydrolase family protein [Gemmatimonadota bacterium]
MTPLPTRPWPNTYWLPGGQILCGEYPGDLDAAREREKLEALAAFNVSTFIDLTTPADGLRPYEPLPISPERTRIPGVFHLDWMDFIKREVHRFPIADVSVPTRTQMRDILETIDDAVARGRTVYVHCWGGIGRTGTVAGCWLRRQGASADDALAMIAERWKTVGKRAVHPHSPETEQQRQFIRDWHEPSMWRSQHFTVIDRHDRIRGCLLGGAVGDALGAPVEFWSHDEIVAQFGTLGIQEFAPAYGRVGAITDDTQMTLFTAEGVLRTHCRDMHRGMASFENGVGLAYQRWLSTQGFQANTWATDHPGWLIGNAELHQQRSPGATCLGALRAAAEERQDYTNESKGCGAVMRAAPCGLLHGEDIAGVYENGVASARVTHHHPEAYVSAGVYAVLIAHLARGVRLELAVEYALGTAAKHRREAPLTFKLLERAMTLAAAKNKRPVHRVRTLGRGFVAEEALAIGVYAALTAEYDFERGVRNAVNHSGDSDSTGSIVGQILGASLGARHIPERWVERVELREVIEQVAEDLATGFRGQENWFGRWPGC